MNKLIGKAQYLLRILEQYICLPYKTVKYFRTGIRSNLLYCKGFPQVKTSGTGRIIQNGRLTMVSNAKIATLGNPRRCKLLVYDNAEIVFHGDTSMSNCVIVATKHIEIGKNVMIGGGVTIIDSDFHSMDYTKWNTPLDETYMKRAPVSIGNNVFIGMEALILKGVHIGDGAIVSARSVVSKDVPANAIVAGNPATVVSYRKQVNG